MYHQKIIQNNSKHPLYYKLLFHIELARLNYLTGMWLLFLPTLWGMCLASKGFPDLRWLVIFLIGSIATRSVGCVFNDLVDVNFDRRVERTKKRPLACGKLTTWDALINLGFFTFIAFGCFLTLPLLAQKICLFALIFIFFYPWMKRLTYWPQAFLGITFNLGVLIAGVAMEGKLTLSQFLLYFSAALWTIFFDTIYAHQDKEDDMMIGVKSTALLFHKYTKYFLLVCALFQILFLSFVGVFSSAPAFYYSGCFLILVFLMAQIFYVDLDNPESCAKIFHSNIILGALIFLNLLLIFYIK